MRSRFVVRWVHSRTGAEAIETVEVALVAGNRTEEAARREAWDKVAEISKRLRPIGYRAEWHRL